MSEIFDIFVTIVSSLGFAKDLMERSERERKYDDRIHNNWSNSYNSDEGTEEILDDSSGFDPDSWFGPGPGYKRALRENNILFTGDIDEVARYSGIFDVLKGEDKHYGNCAGINDSADIKLERLIECFALEDVNCDQLYRDVTRIREFLGDDLYNCDVSYCCNCNYFYPAFFGKYHNEDRVVTIPKKVIGTGTMSYMIEDFFACLQDLRSYVECDNSLRIISEKWKTPLLLLNQDMLEK